MNMGLGAMGGSQLLFKRNFRWTFTVNNICNVGANIPESFVKLASRPNWTTEDIEVDYLNAKTWIPGKTSLETLSVTYYDVATIDHQNLWNWLASVYNFTNPVTLTQASMRSDYSATGILVMYDGCGQPLEQWTLGGMWPSGVNFGELDMGSSEVSTIELTLRYDRLTYKSICPKFTPQACCNPCSGTTGTY